MLCCALFCVLSSFFNQPDGEERAGCFILFVFLIYFNCKCSVTYPRGAMAWSVVLGSDNS